MNFISYGFLLFFPVVVLLYFVLPKKIRWIWLLVSSYFFYMCWNAKYALLLLASTFITWVSGLLISKADANSDENKAKRLKKWAVAGSFVLNLGILFFFKYFSFAVDNINILLGALGKDALSPSFDLLLPVGISFYTFQALSYTADVYRREVEPEKNFFRYALYVSFFPQLVAGPIERSSNLLPQMRQVHTWDSARVKSGLLTMALGFFEKMVIADRAAIFVNAVFAGRLDLRPGILELMAIFAFGIQIYCDFAGYSHIAIGAARVLGFKLMENFDRPYFAVSVRDFWRRWHISLSTWFKDYLYIPLGGNRKGKLRKYLNTMITFILSGLWHGANWSFVIWGGLHGLYQVIGDILKPVKNFVLKITKANPDSFGLKFIKGVFVYLLVNFTWLFFRAQSIKQTWQIITCIFTNFQPWTLFDKSIQDFISPTELGILFISIAILVIISVLKGKTDIIGKIEKQPLIFRWAFYICVILVIFIFGVYGPEFNAGEFIYFRF